MNFTHVQVEQVNSVAIFRLDHPPANVLSQVTLNDLSAALDIAEQESSVKVIIVTGKGKFFAAGADIKEFTSVENEAQGRQIAKIGQQLFERMELFPKPIIAAIHGAALGGGLELGMACHLRFSTPNAKLGLPELNLGLIPGFAGTQRLPRMIGKAKALEMILTSKPITGIKAAEYGLVNQCVPEEQLLDHSLRVAETIATKSGDSIRFLLQAMTHGEREGFERGSAIEAEMFGKLFETEDTKEGIQAFLEKRKPQFK